jgi:glutathione S-transferase
MEVNDVPYVTKPVLRGMFTDSGSGEELRERGGKVQVPYLVDPERDVEMYESEDIIAYIQEHYVGNR